jgi:hypothetical protein
MSLFRAPRSHHEMLPKTVSLFHTLRVTQLNP